MSKLINSLETATILKNAHKIVLIGHVSPDGDTLGSTLALALGLKKLGKDIVVTVDDSISAMYNFLPGLEQIIRLEDEAKIKADLMVVIDASSADRAGNAIKCVDAPILNIDHHISNTRYAEYLYLDDKAAATGEIIFKVLKNLEVEIDLAMAINLYTAIVTDCGYFKYSNTSPECMRCAAELIEFGVNPSDISDALEMKPKSNIVLLSKVLESLSFFHEGKIAVIEIKNEDYNAEIDTDAFIQYPRYIEGVEVAVMFKAVKPNVTRVSMRSRWIDVSLIALHFDGGGHKKAAGCTINADLNEAKQTLVAKIIEEMDRTK